MLTVEVNDPMARGWYTHDWEELSEMTFLKRYSLQPGAIVFDVGAHQCVVAMMLANIVKPGLVVAVEGNGYNASVGKRNAERNHFRNLEVLHGAGGATPGEITFSENWNGQVNLNGPDVGNVKVRCYSIDELSQLYGTPQVLFIDVEGFESDVLMGANKTLATFPDCFVEVHIGKLENYGVDAAKILSYFSREHYRLYWKLDREKEEFEEFLTSTPMPTERFFLLAIARDRKHSAALSNR
jgi:FkbM family methyltransferase